MEYIKLELDHLPKKLWEMKRRVRDEMVKLYHTEEEHFQLNKLLNDFEKAIRKDKK